jgi:dolichol-phosphate mannosyltransferase
MTGGAVYDYSRVKLVVNRLVNWGIRVLFGHGYDDTTNAFKATGARSSSTLLSHHFNLTVEIPLKSVVRGHSYAITPIRWTNQKTGESKLKLHEQGSRYAYIVLMVFLEHHLSRGDYGQPDTADAGHRWRAGKPAARFYERSQSPSQASSSSE